MCMGALGKFLDIQNCQRGICDCFAEHRFGILPECCIQLFLGGIRIDKSHVDTHPLHRNGNQIKGSAVNGAGSHNMISASANIEQRKKVGCLSAAGQHGRSASLQLRNLRRHIIICRILESRIKITAGFQVKKLSHILAGVIFKSCALNNGNLARLPVSRCITSLYTDAVDIHVFLTFPPQSLRQNSIFYANKLIFKYTHSRCEIQAKRTSGQFKREMYSIAKKQGILLKDALFFCMHSHSSACILMFA